MGMGVGASHCSALILKDLHPFVLGTQDCHLLDPGVHHGPDLLHTHDRDGYIGLWAEAHYFTLATGSSNSEQWVSRILGFRDIL